MPIPTWLLHYNQTDLFGDSFRDKKLTLGLTRVIVGQFYEIFLSRYVKGQLNDNQEQAGLRPDVIVNHKISPDIYEVKAGRKRIICDHTQWEYYKKLKENDFPYHKPNIFYALFFHNVKCLEVCQTVSELIKALCDHTQLGIILPLERMNILIKDESRFLYNYGDGWGRVNRGDKAGNHKHNLYTSIHYATLTHINNVRKLKIRNIEITGNKIKQFPFYKYEG